MDQQEATSSIKLSRRIARSIRFAEDCLQRASDGNEELSAHCGTMRYVVLQLERARRETQLALDLISDHEHEFPDQGHVPVPECNCRACCSARVAADHPDN